MTALVRILREYGLAETTLTKGLLAFASTTIGVLLVFFLIGFAFWFSYLQYETGDLGIHIKHQEKSPLDHCAMGWEVFFRIGQNVTKEQVKFFGNLFIFWYFGVRLLGTILSFAQKESSWHAEKDVRYAEFKKEMKYLAEENLLENHNKSKNFTLWVRGITQATCVACHLFLLYFGLHILIALANGLFGWWSDYVSIEWNTELLEEASSMALILILFLWPSIRYAKLLRPLQVTLIFAFLSFTALLGASGSRMYGSQLVKCWTVDVAGPGNAYAGQELVLLATEGTLARILDLGRNEVFLINFSTDTRITYKERAPLSKWLDVNN